MALGKSYRSSTCSQLKKTEKRQHHHNRHHKNKENNSINPIMITSIVTRTASRSAVLRTSRTIPAMRTRSLSTMPGNFGKKVRLDIQDKLTRCKKRLINSSLYPASNVCCFCFFVRTTTVMMMMIALTARSPNTQTH